jgi:transcriptional regulator with XRE-family HTH domain
MAMDEAVGNEAARTLGAALRGERLARGLSLRVLARQIGLSAHGTLVDYEHGRRIPPADIVTGCERVLGIADARLQRLRDAALAERGARQAAELLHPVSRVDSMPVPPVPGAGTAEDGAGDVASASRRRIQGLPALTVAAILLVIALGADVPWSSGNVPTPRVAAAASMTPAAPVRIGFEQPSERWWILWGSQVAQGEVTTSVAYEGTHSFLVTVTGAAATKGYSAVGVAHGLETLHPGMRVTMHLWTSRPGDVGVRFFAMNSASTPVWAAETAYTEITLTPGSEWSTQSWTVPPVDVVHAIGMQIYTETDAPVLVAIDSVAW